MAIFGYSWGFQGWSLYYIVLVSWRILGHLKGSTLRYATIIVIPTNIMDIDYIPHSL